LRIENGLQILWAGREKESSIGSVRSCTFGAPSLDNVRTHPVTDFLDEKRNEITKRLAELKPSVDEYTLLEAAVKALNAVGGATPAAPAAAAPRRRGRPPGVKPRAAARAKRGASARSAKPKATKATKAKPAKGKPTARGRRKGSGSRAAEALSFVQGQPGIAIPELAARMGIKQNYLYRVLPALEGERKVEKKGRGWHPVAAA